MPSIHRQRLRSILAHAFIVLLLFQTTSCNYFRVREAEPSEVPSIKTTGRLDKRFIVHYQNELYTLDEVDVDESSLIGKLSLSTDSALYEEGRGFRYKKENKAILHEVHIYVKADAPAPEIGAQGIPFSDIEKMDVIEWDSGKTVASYLLTGVGIAAATFVIVFIIVLLTKSSCPYVYVNNGEAFVFTGEMYGGAIAPNLERDDFMPLPGLTAENGIYQLRISNELKEKQYTDLAELVLVEHDPEHRALMDSKGGIHLIKQELSAQKALANGSSDITSSLAAVDQDVFFFNEATHSQNSVELTFDRPEDATTANLVLTAKNTLWFDYLVGEFFSKFGGSFDMWLDKQKELTKEERLATIRQQEFPLSVYVKVDDKWELVEEIQTVGPLANRDFVVPLDALPASQTQVEIKLETGFMFWELDYAAMDFIPHEDLNLHVLQPSSAIDHEGVDRASLLAFADEQRLAQETTGDVCELHYPQLEPAPGQTFSAFLHARGYYEWVREFSGLPEVSELQKFKEKGHFSDYSRAEYVKLISEDLEAALQLETTNP